MQKAGIDKIHFHFLCRPFFFSHRNQLKHFLGKALKKQAKSVEMINYIFCEDSYLLQFNRQFLQHDTYTDIITFELSTKDQPLLADVYISVERVRENAKLFNSSFKRELHRVIFHGMLHLLGYKDKSNKDSVLMRANEEALLKRYFNVPREKRGKINRFPVKRIK